MDDFVNFFHCFSEKGGKDKRAHLASKNLSSIISSMMKQKRSDKWISSEVNLYQ